MFGSAGIGEIILIFIVVLLLFGPKKLPEIGRSIGKALGEFKRATNDLKRALEEEVAADELKQTRREIEEAVRPSLSVAHGEAAAPGAPATPSASDDSPAPQEPKPPATEPS